jgi:hypothetical protein
VNKYLVILLFFCTSLSQAQSDETERQAKFDSLWNVWSDESVADTSRLEALRDWTWQSKLFSEPDSGF